MVLLSISFSAQLAQSAVSIELNHVATYDTPGSAKGVFVVDDKAYIADQHSDLQIVDVSDKSNPTFLGSGYFTSSTRFGIEVLGDYCFISGWNNKLPIFDVSEPATPVLVEDDYYLPISDACDFVIRNDIIYIADWIHCFYIFDISNPSSPTALGSYGTFQANDIDIRGNYAYLATSAGIVILDISDVNSPSFVDIYNTASRVDGVTIVDDYLYVAGGSQGLMVFNITDSTNPELLDSIDTPGFAVRVEVRSNHAFVCDGTGGLRIIDVNDPFNLTLSDALIEYNQSSNIFFLDDYAYLTNSDYGLEIFKVKESTKKSNYFAISGIFVILMAVIIKRKRTR